MKIKVMKYRDFGNSGKKLSASGSGCRSMRHAYTGRVDKNSVATLKMALDPGINFRDTADYYCSRKNEILISGVAAFNLDRTS
jgi:aryl-alcohol dehydrogenase-like predicted oxidoreductase